MARTPFDPRRHALPFANWFERGTPVITLPTPLGRLRLGDAHGGLCGGMVFAALDGYFWGVPPPRHPTPQVVRYLARRLLASWNMPAGLVKYYRWQRADQPALSRLMTEVEWPRIRAQLDAGVPVALGVVKPQSRDPRRLVQNHQVLAYGYEQSVTGVRLDIYDPNYPDDPDATLDFGPDPMLPLMHSCEGGTVRGIFVTRYRRPLTPPDWGGSAP